MATSTPTRGNKRKPSASKTSNVSAGSRKAVEKANGRGQQLVDRLQIFMQKKGLSQTALAKRYIGISPNHFCQMMNGERYIGTTDRKVLEKFATILGASMAQIYLWAEILTDSDFVIPNEREQILDHIGQSILANPMCAGFVGNMETWDSWPYRAKVVIGLLLQGMTGEQLINMPIIDVPEANADGLAVGKGPGSGGVH